MNTSQEIPFPLDIEDIEIPAGRRPVTPAAVKRLADSIEEIGLKHPITVRRKGERYILVAGLHRLEACRKLGREHVPAIICTMTNAEARMWEIAENLHRADLTKQERADQIAEWVDLVSTKLKETKREGRPGAQAAASRELGVPESEVRRSVKIASMTPEAKEAARDAELDDNQSALLQIASEPAEQQVAAVHRLAKKKPRVQKTWRDKFEEHWSKGTEDDHAWAREHIDNPIMDRKFA